MALKDIIGQDRPVNILRGCIAKERIPHALLFTGDKGIGKRLTAVNFAKALNCQRVPGEEFPITGSFLFEVPAPEHPGPELETQSEACDTCPSCKKIERGNHPDVFLIGPEGDGGQITVQAIRQLEESLSYKPFEGRWKIAIVDEADRLNQSAANAFLQTLEEPSAQSMLILISSRPDLLLPTIRSRCQRISFSPLPVDTMSRLLKERFGDMDDERARLLSVLSGGRLGYALGDNLIDQRERCFSMFGQLLESLEEEPWEDKEAMEEWFEWSQLLLRDMAVYSATGREDFLMNTDRAEYIKAISRGAGLKDILKLARELYNIKRRLAFNLNKQLTYNFVSLLLRNNLGQSGRE
ncbi:MAG TPA: DNA polymerase III subunit delta' [Nitrospiraceae bacterium]|nr:DNA polymerase III subunit delta' [Nitrospiraceae bacterium]